MSEILHDTAHVSEGLALLTGDNAKANIQAILTAWLDQIQSLEDAIFAVYQSRILDNAVGEQLDLLGALVGEPRNNRSDTFYKVGIRVRILVNFSDGTPEDLAKIGVAGAPDATTNYVDSGGGHFQISMVNLTANDDPTSLATAFDEAKANGTSGDFIFSSSGTAAFQWCAVGASSPMGWDDVADTLGIGKWCSVDELT